MKHCYQKPVRLSIQFKVSKAGFINAVNINCEILFDVRKDQYENFIERFELKTKDVIKTSIPTNDLKLSKDWKCVTIFCPHITDKTKPDTYGICLRITETPPKNI